MGKTHPNYHYLPRNATTTNDYSHLLASLRLGDPKRRACSQLPACTSGTPRGAARRTPYTTACTATPPSPPPGTWTVLSTVRPRRRKKPPCGDHSPSTACSSRGCRPRSRPASTASHVHWESSRIRDVRTGYGISHGLHAFVLKYRYLSQFSVPLLIRCDTLYKYKWCCGTTCDMTGA